LVVAAGSACDGRAVRQVPWPRECVIASLRRGRQVMIPRGDTILRPGDVLVVVAEGEARETARKLTSVA
jgi:CIC family chloride channel protein